MIHKERVRLLGDRPGAEGDYVLYWMQASQREACNHALEFAVEQANGLGLPVLVYFGLTPRYPEANLRHYAFMLDGLAEVGEALAERGIGFVIRNESPDLGAVRMSRRAALLVVDRGYMRHERAWRAAAGQRAACPVYQVETNVVVPVEKASSKEEYSAATFRPKIRRLLSKYLVPLKRRPVRKKYLAWDFETLDLADTSRILARLRIERSVGRAPFFLGGESQAGKRLEAFARRPIFRYAEERSDPATDLGSRMSPYLHFGQVSPLAIALRAKKAAGLGPEAFLEELIVRRELSMNFVFHKDRCDRFESVPDWCRATLREHARERKKAAYSPAELEDARTHDPNWNAAQHEMACLGRMQNTMRMYWGKRILEWHRDPAEAYRLAVHLNNKYELDGRDPNGYAGVAWCFGKHDRPWPSQPGFGTVRSMKSAGLEHKYDMAAYIDRVARACAAAAPAARTSTPGGQM